MPTKVTERLAIGAVIIPPVALLVLSVTFAVSTLLGSQLAWPVRDLSLPEAVLLRDAGEMARLIGNGADLNEAAVVHRGIEGDRELHMLPLEAAVVAKEPEILGLLLAHGARVDDLLRVRLLCFADRVDAREVAALLKDPAVVNTPDCTNISTPW